MRLLAVLQGPARLMRNQTSAVMEEGRLVIGRATSCDWILADPERLISAQHCRIDKDEDRFVITDTSTNGIQLNGELVGFGNSRELENGAVLLLSDAMIAITIERERGPKARPVISPSVRPKLLDDPFASGSPMPASPDLTIAQATRLEPASGILSEDWWIDSKASPTHAQGFKAANTQNSQDVCQACSSLQLSALDLLSQFPRCNVEGLAKAIDMAGAALEPEVWRALLERLGNALQNEAETK